MTKRVEKAMELHKKGYNCAQAVACSFCDVVQMDEDTLFRVTEAFGGGMGGMKGTCGAISGACAVAGLLRSEGKEQCKSCLLYTSILAQIIRDLGKDLSVSIFPDSIFQGLKRGGRFGEYRVSAIEIDQQLFQV